MGVTAASEGAVSEATARVVLHGDASPVVEGRSQALRARLAHLDATGLAASFGDRRDAGQSPQGVIVSRSDGVMSQIALQR